MIDSRQINHLETGNNESLERTKHRPNRVVDIADRNKNKKRLRLSKQYMVCDSIFSKYLSQLIYLFFVLSIYLYPRKDLVPTKTISDTILF